jgi:hypothetical protein
VITITSFNLGDVSDADLDAEVTKRDTLASLQTAIEAAYTAGHLPQDLYDLLDRVTATVYPNDIV